MDRLWNFTVLADARSTQLDAAPDVLAIDAACTTITPTLLADTFLDQGFPTAEQGTLDAIVVSNVSNVADIGLFKFDVSGLDLAEHITDLQLTLLQVAGSHEAKACMNTALDTVCTLCENTYETWELRWVVSSWSETTATFNEASTGVSWGAPGATGAADRSAVITSGTQQSPLVIHATAQELASADPTPFLLAGPPTTLSLQLAVTNGVGTFAPKDANQCEMSTPPPPAALQLTVCY